MHSIRDQSLKLYTRLQFAKNLIGSRFAFAHGEGRAPIKEGDDMERERYISNESAYGAATGESLFGLDAVAKASPVEPLPPPQERIVVDLYCDTAVHSRSGHLSGVRYLTSLAAFVAALALAAGVFAGGNLLLNYGDQFARFWNGGSETPLVTDAAASGAVAQFRSERPRRTRVVAKADQTKAAPAFSGANFEQLSEEPPAELPAGYFEDRDPREGFPRAGKGGERDKDRRQMKKTRTREPEDLKELVETIERWEGN